MKEKETKDQDLEQLRIFKKKSGWNYEKIGIRMGIHPQTVVFWLTGKHRPGKLARNMIRKFLDEYFIK